MGRIRATTTALWAVLGLAGGCAAEHVIGSSGLLEAQLYPSGLSGVAVQALAAADLDGDGRSDVALFDGSGRICVMAGTAEGGLGLARCQLLPTGALLSAVALWRQPGGPWSLVAGGDAVQALVERTDGTFAVTATAAAGGLNALAAADVSGDGLPEVLGAERQSPTVAVWPLTADGLFGTPIRYQFASPQSSILYADLDGDFRPELAALGAGSLSVYGASGAAAVTPCPAGGTQAFALPLGLAALDVERDGRMDLVAADSGRSGLVAFRNVTAAAAAQLHFDCGTAPLLVAVDGLAALLGADLDGDGATDGVALGSEIVLVRGQRPSQGPSPSVTRHALPSPAQAGALVDLDRDGRLDVVAALGSGSVAILRNSFQ